MTERISTDKMDDLPLIGRCFIFWHEERKKGLWKYTGMIRANPEPGIYLIQYFEAMMGFPNDMKLLHIDELMSENYQLFFDNIEMDEWIKTHQGWKKN